MRDTWDVFNQLDKDEDGAVSQSEFFDAMVARLMDNESGQIVASQLLDSNHEEEVLPLLDVVSEEESQDLKQRKDINDLLNQEFQKLDTDGDGLIQAAEFDKDIE